MLSTAAMAKYAVALSALFASATAFDASANNNVALYWGQASAGSQESLATYCESDAADIMILSFMSSFPGTNDLPTLNFAAACSETFSDGLLKCDQIAADIQTCQSLGKKVLLSMGGAAGSYGFTSDAEAEDFAGTLWNMFGEGSADERPFGDAVVDGFDFDIENNNDAGYAALATKLRSYFSEGSKSYYLSAAPQCVYPDASVGDALANAEFDFAFIQFYNNYCAIGSSFNWDTWVDYAENTSPNKNIKLYLGLPGSTTAAGSGYVDIDTIKSTLAQIGDDSQFGGVMLWDASQGFTNTVDGEPFAEAIKDAMSGLSGAATTTAATTATTEAAVTTKASATTETAATTEAASTTTTAPAAAQTTTSTSTPAAAPTSVTTSTPAASVTTSTPAAAPTSVTTLTPVGTAEVEQTTSIKVITSTFVDKGASVDPTTTTKSTSASTQAPASTPAEQTTTSTQAPAEETTTSTPAPAPAPETTTTTSSSSTFVEVTSNTFTKSAGSTLKTVLVSTTTSSTAASASSTTPASSGCDSLTGSDKASCLNAQYTAGQFAGSPNTCTNGETACSSTGEYAICNWGTWVVQACAAGTTCYAAPEGDDVFISCNWPQNEKHKRNTEHVHHDHA